MSLQSSLDRHLRGEENTQLLAVLVLLLTLVLLFGWTSNPAASNDSWYSVSAVRLAGLGLFAVWSAVQSSQRGQHEPLAGYLATLLVAAVTVPFELVAFAASYPAASLPATLAFSFSYPLGLYGVSLLLARLFGRARWLALPAVLVLMAALFMLDGLTGLQVLSPVTILGTDSWLLVGNWTVIAAATAAWLLLKRDDDE